MSTFFKLVFLVVATLLLSSCRENELKRMPDTLPDIRGNITSLSRSDENGENATVSIVVKAMDGVEVKVMEANINVTEETLIEDSDGKRLSTAALQNSQEVEAWLVPEMMESSPVQADAIAIRIPDRSSIHESGAKLFFREIQRSSSSPIAEVLEMRAMLIVSRYSCCSFS